MTLVGRNVIVLKRVLMCARACLCKLLFEHVFTEEAGHMLPHKELIGFNPFFKTEISWLKLKRTSTVFEVY